MARFQRNRGISLSRAVHIGCQAVGFAGRTGVHLATGILAGTAENNSPAVAFGGLALIIGLAVMASLDRLGRR